jgi:hypothetical protein
MNAEVIRGNILAVCQNGKAKDILKKADGKKTYNEIARIVKVHPTLCCTILNKACSYQLANKVSRGIYKRIINMGDIDAALKGKSTSITETIKVKKKKKSVNTETIKKQILEYLLSHHSIIYHPFSIDKKDKLPKEKLQKAYYVLIQNLEEDLGLVQIEGLASRFYNSFSDFLSCSTLNKSEIIASFSNLIKCFEPYLKKTAAIKNNDNSLALKSLDEDVIKKAIPFSSKIKDAKAEYWSSKDIHEACIRYVYPYRHKEAHEARDYPVFEIQRIVYYMFASIIYMNIL